MAGNFIPENILEDILGRVDIVELISAYMPLKRAGRNFKAVCPFHHEKTPSFVVSAEKQIYHCFGCGESGNAFKFLMRYERLEFPEAVESLAKKTGVALPQAEKIDRKTASIATQLYAINELAVKFYAQALNSPAGLHAKKYLLKRGIDEEAIRSFKLGFALDKWDALISFLRSKNISLSLIERAGLILSREGGGYYDRFRNRIIFPIFDIKSRVAGFGARVLPDNSEEKASLAKYINSPETSVYTKGKNLYGLNFAFDAIRENDSIAVVEGYFDFIVPYQSGIKNIAASLGTALTVEQARLLKRYTHNIVMVYDGDAAGEIAALRSLDIFIEEGMNVKVVSLPIGFDPDSFVREYGVENFKKKIKESENLFNYKLKVLKSRHNHKDIEGKAVISASMLELINKFKNSVLKSEYIKKLTEELNVEEGALLQDLKKIKPDKPFLDTGRMPAGKRNSSPTERLLIKLMLEERGLINRIRESLEPADFQDEQISRIVSIMFEFIAAGKDVEPNKLINYFSDEGISSVICESVLSPELSGQDKEKVVCDCIRRLKTNRMLLRKQRLQEEIKSAEESGDEARLDILKQEFNGLIKIKL